MAKLAMTWASSYTFASATGEPSPLTYAPAENSFMVIWPDIGAVIVQ